MRGDFNVPMSCVQSYQCGSDGAIKFNNHAVQISKLIKGKQTVYKQLALDFGNHPEKISNWALSPCEIKQLKYPHWLFNILVSVKNYQITMF